MQSSHSTLLRLGFKVRWLFYLLSKVHTKLVSKKKRKWIPLKKLKKAKTYIS